jgi:hypothetical protein
VRRTLVATIIVPLALLSLMPHQELRFLLPMMLPLTLLYAPSLEGTAMLLVWGLWHALFAAFFSLTHQAAVVPAIAALQDMSMPTATRGAGGAGHAGHAGGGGGGGGAGGAGSGGRGGGCAAHTLGSPAICSWDAELPVPTYALFYRTYPPPPALLGMPSSHAMPLRLMDLGGASEDELRRTLSGLARTAAGGVYIVLPPAHAHVLESPHRMPAVCSPPEAATARRQQRTGRRWAWWAQCTAARLLTRARGARALRAVRVRRLWPHFSGEDPPQRPSDAALEIHLIVAEGRCHV